MAPKIKRADSEGSVVVVDIGGDHSAPNDLMSRLSFNLSQFHDAGSQHDVIFEPSELVIFQLKTPGSQPSFSGTSKSSPDPFIYQKTIYMDQFLVKNLEIANRKRALEREMLTEINQLVAQKQILTRHNVRVLRRTIVVRNVHPLLRTGTLSTTCGRLYTTLSMSPVQRTSNDAKPLTVRLRNSKISSKRLATKSKVGHPRLRRDYIIDWIDNRDRS